MQVIDGYTAAANEHAKKVLEPFRLESAPPAKRQYKTPYPRQAKKVKEQKWKSTFDMPIQIKPIDDREAWFRHTHWKVKRDKVMIALRAAHATEKQLDAFVNCGADCVVEIEATTQQYRIRGQYCHNRHCEPCQKAKANLLAANLKEKLAEAKSFQYRFITLTLKHNDAPLREQIDRLNASFKKLRQTKFWKQSQTGGAAILEVKWKPGTRHWHPHLHIIAEGSFIRKQDLSDHWLKITGDSSIVDIRTLDSGKDAAHYVAKYVSKGTNDDVWDDTDASIEWIISLHNVRTAATFGRWRGFKLLAKSEQTGDWRPLGSLTKIVQLAFEGNEYYIRLVQQLEAEKQYNPHKPRLPKNKPPL
jgi:hypothetical protein